jgi:hypothetical protein
MDKIEYIIVNFPELLIHFWNKYVLGTKPKNCVPRFINGRYAPRKKEIRWIGREYNDPPKDYSAYKFIGR